MAASSTVAYLLLQKGSSQQVDVPAVAHVQMLSFTQFPFAFLSVVLTRVAVAAGLSRNLMLVSVVGAVLNVVLDLVFVRHMGIGGIALSTTALFAATSLLLMFSMRGLGVADKHFTSSSQRVGN
jgi:putative peptidoglycan lipid II flippase